MKLLIILLMLFSALILYGCNPGTNSGIDSGGTVEAVELPEDSSAEYGTEVARESGDEEISEVVEEFAGVVDGATCAQANCIEQEECLATHEWSSQQLKCVVSKRTIMFITTM